MASISSSSPGKTVEPPETQLTSFETSSFASETSLQKLHLLPNTLLDTDSSSSPVQEPSSAESVVASTAGKDVINVSVSEASRLTDSKPSPTEKDQMPVNEAEVVVVMVSESETGKESKSETSLAGKYAEKSVQVKETTPEEDPLNSPAKERSKSVIKPSGSKEKLNTEKASPRSVISPLKEAEKMKNSPKSGETSGKDEAVKAGGVKMVSGGGGGMKVSPSANVMENNAEQLRPSPNCKNGGLATNREWSSMVEEAWEYLKKSIVHYKGKAVGTLAAVDPGAEALNYNQVFVRDFVPSALAFLMNATNPKGASSLGETDIVKNFLLKALHLQGSEKRIDNFTLGQGVMPASFKVEYDKNRKKDTIYADFGGTAIGRVAPVDSGFWWIILLRSYTRCTRDHTLSERPEMQRGMRLILNLCLSDGFDTFPTLLCADGCSMIDRRMGVYGYPIEIQALFFFALRCAQQMLKPENGGKELMERIDQRVSALSYHIRTYFWLDFPQLNNIYRYRTEEYSDTAVNKFNVIPESIPDWVFDFMPLRGGYFIGNVSPARMDFRWFLVGNCIAILSSLATPQQATAIMELFEARWEDLIGEMPLKVAFPALEGHEWQTVTGCDPKNTRWSYHNGGSWPAACIKCGKPQIAKRAIEQVEQRLANDGWPEYYDGKTGRYIGKQARKYQTWSISGYLVAKMMIENPANLFMISMEEDKKIAKPKLRRSASWTANSSKDV